MQKIGMSILFIESAVAPTKGAILEPRKVTLRIDTLARFHECTCQPVLPTPANDAKI